MTHEIFSYEFFISGKNHPNYKYRAFVFQYGLSPYPVNFFIDEDIINELYPVEVKKDDIENPEQAEQSQKATTERIYRVVNNENELIDLLDKILKSNTVTNVINSLLSMG